MIHPHNHHLRLCLRRRISWTSHAPTPLQIRTPSQRQIRAFSTAARSVPTLSLRTTARTHPRGRHRYLILGLPTSDFLMPYPEQDFLLLLRYLRSLKLHLPPRTSARHRTPWTNLSSFPAVRILRPRAHTLPTNHSSFRVVRPPRTRSIHLLTQTPVHQRSLHTPRPRPKLKLQHTPTQIPMSCPTRTEYTLVVPRSTLCHCLRPLFPRPVPPVSQTCH